MAPARSLRLLRTSVTTFAVALSALAVRAEAQAQIECAGSGPEGPIPLDRSAVAACVDRATWIEHAIIQGSDVVELAQQPGLPIRIRNSAIEHGFYFRGLQAIRVNELEEPLRQRVRDLQLFKDISLVTVVHRDIKLQAVRISAGLEYTESEYSWAALIANRTVFAGDFDLGGSTIEGSSHFYRAVFLGRAAFEGVRFAYGVTFDTARFADDALFGGAHFQGPARFSSARFGSEARFRGARFDRQPNFDWSSWCEEASFAEASFADEARFTGAALESGADFEDAELAKGADFSSARSARTLSLTRSSGAGTLAFVGARVEKLEIGSRHHRTRVDAELDLTCAQVTSAALRTVRLNAPVSFAHARIGGRRGEPGLCPLSARVPRRPVCAAPPDKGSATPPELVLDRVDFSDKVTWEGAAIRAQVSLHDVSFDAGGNFADVTFESPRRGEPFLAFSDVDFTGVNLDWDSVPTDPALFMPSTRDRPALPPSALFGALEERYGEQKRLDDVLAARRARRAATVAEARACLVGARPSCRRPDALPGSLFFATVYPLWGMASRFGTSLPRLLLVIALVDLGFAMLYRYRGRLMRRTSPGEAVSSMRLRPLEVPATFAPKNQVEGRWAVTRKLRDALALSTTVLLRFGRTDVIVRGSVGKLDLRHLVALEWLLGIPLLVDLIYTLTETQPFLQRLLTGAIG